LGQPELHRLSKGKIGAVGIRALSGLQELLRGNLDQLQTVLVSPEAAELVQAFGQWIDAENSRLWERRRLGNTEVTRAVEATSGWEEERQAEFDWLLGRSRSAYPDLFNKFDAFLVSRQHYKPRAELAYARILAPLLNWRESGFVERTWTELSRLERRRFIKAGMVRERILLTRAPDLQRAQQAAERDQLELLRFFGPSQDPKSFFRVGMPQLLRRYARERKSARR
jgi:hypothetical protein